MLLIIYTYLRASIRKEVQTSQWCSLKVCVAKGTKSNIRKSFLNVRVIKHLNKFPRDIVDFPFLQLFKKELDEALGKLFSCHFQVQVFLYTYDDLRPYVYPNNIHVKFGLSELIRTYSKQVIMLFLA